MLMPDKPPVTAEDLRERAEAAVEDWFNHLADDDEPTVEQIGRGVADTVLAALAGDPGDLPARMAAEMRKHYILTNRTTPDGHGLCACGHWSGGEMGPDWDEHLAEVAASVRWEDNARTKAELAEIKRVTEPPADDDEMPTDPAEMREMWEFINRQARWQWHMAHKFGGQMERLRAERDAANLIVEELQALRDTLYGQLDSAQAERDALKAAIADVRRLCDMTIAASCRAYAIEQAEDTLAVLDRALAAPETPGDAETEDRP